VTFYSGDVHRLKKISLKMAFHSNRGYKEMSSLFALPSKRSLRRQLSNIRCAPGFLEDVIKQIEEDINKNSHGRNCVLILDEMAIRSGLSWDPELKTYLGNLTITSDGKQSETKLGNSVLVFLLSGLDKRWYHPIAWFITSHLKGSAVDPLVSQALEKTHASGINVRGIVFDGLGANFTAIEAFALINGPIQGHQ
jgi:Transposase protein